MDYQVEDLADSLERFQLNVRTRPELPGTLGKPVKLVCNLFDLRYPALKLYEFQVQCFESVKVNARGRGRGRGAPTPQKTRDTPLKNRELVRHLFWETMRKFENVFSTTIVFDDYERAWSLNAGPDRPFVDVIPMPKTTNKSLKIVITHTPLSPFTLNVCHNNPAVAASSQMALRCIFTQSVRYMPDRNDRDSWDFYSRFDASAAGIYPVSPKASPAIPPIVSPPYVHFDIKPGVQAWTGLLANIRAIANRKAVLNVGLVNQLFQRLDMDLVSFYVEVIKEIKVVPNDEDNRDWRQQVEQMTMTEAQRKEMQKYFIGMRVKTFFERGGALIIKETRGRQGVKEEVALLERHYKVLELTPETADRYVVFKGKTLREMYHKMGVKLQFPYLPLAYVQSGANKQLLPLEVLYTHDTPERYKLPLDFFTTHKFIKAVTREPTDYVNCLTTYMKKAGLTTKDNFFANNFGVSLNPALMECEGLVLDPPVLLDKKGNPVEFNEDRSFKALELNETPAKVVLAVVIGCVGGKTCVELSTAGKFHQNIVKVLRMRGVEIHEDPPQVYDEWDLTADDNYDSLLAICESESKRFAILQQNSAEKLTHLVIMINAKETNSYGLIKLLMNNKFGLPSQVVDKSTVYDAVNARNGSIYHAIAIKINSKLGGLNISTDEGAAQHEEKDLNVMYVGIDVTHPSPNSGLEDISLASMVGSLNPAATRYAHEIYAQMKPKETVECFNKQFQALMFKYHDANGRFPDHVVVYRDGVSDSQIVSTSSVELEWIQKVWENIASKEDIKLPTYTYIVVQKRHTVRFFKPDGNKGYTNVESGTVIDRKITSPKFFDFWMASHHAQKGTTRPAHYTVVYDEWNRTADQIYFMTYRLCFLNARVRKPISIPAPVHYADLVCDKAKEMYRSAKKFGLIPSFNQDTPADRLIIIKNKIEDLLTLHVKYPGMSFT